MEGEGSFLRSVKNFVDRIRIKRAEGRGDVTSVDLLGSRLGLTTSDKDPYLDRAYDNLIKNEELNAQTVTDQERIERHKKARDVVLKRIHSGEAVENS